MDEYQPRFKRTEIADIPQDPNFYPNLLWTRQVDRYWEFWYYYDGEVLDEEVEGAPTDTGKAALKYPLRINMIRTAVQKHAFALLGEYDQTGILEFRAKPGDLGSEDPLVRELESFLEDVWDENSQLSTLPEQARIAHICGGAVFKIASDDTKPSGIRLEVILPDYFFPVWDGTDYHNLLSAIVSYLIPTQEAVLKFGFVPDAASSADHVLYQERWTQDSYEITIDGKPIKNPRTDLPYGGKNPFIDPDTGRGIVPFVYLPVGRCGEFYGTSIIPLLKGIQDEFNLRMADVGDAINEGVHPLRYACNLSKKKETIKLSRYTIVNLGTSLPGHDAPEVDYVKHPGLPVGTDKWLDLLKGEFREHAHTPPVAYGIDEGSQRSALTLAFRMWPTTSHTRDTRAFWSEALIMLCRKAVIIHMRKAKSPRVEAKHLGLRVMVIWPPIIPRDREQLVSEQLLLVQGALRSPQTALQRLGDVTDIDGEIEKIKEWRTWLAELAAITGAAAGGQEAEELATGGVETEIDEPEAEAQVE